jgi:hypothetical protein
MQPGSTPVRYSNGGARHLEDDPAWGHLFAKDRLFAGLPASHARQWPSVSGLQHIERIRSQAALREAASV